MPKLLQINVSANDGSTGRIAEDIGKQAIHAGWESYIAYARGMNHSKSNLIKIGNPFDYFCHGIETRLFDRHGLASKRATKKFIQHVKQINPDIIHLHNIHGYYLNYVILFDFLKEWGGPVVWTLHDIWPFTGHCAYFGIDECPKWRTGCGNCPNLKSFPKSIYIDGSYKNWILKKKTFTSLPNLTLVPVSNWLSYLLEESFLKGIPKVTIHNGVDTTVFSPCINKKQHYVLGVAYLWDSRKGLQEFYELRKLLPDSIGIKLVGLTEDQIIMLPKGIEGIKRTSSIDELAKLYANAIAFINPTFEDNFPTVNIEALSSGTPVITYKTGGSPEAIDDRTGFVVNQGDVHGLASAIEKILAYDIEKYKVSCRERALNLFKKDAQYAKYIEEYQNLTNVKNGGGYVICVASVWTKEKGIYDVIELRKLLPSNELIVIVGVSQNQIQMLPRGVIGIKRTTNTKDLSMLYSAADAFINPTHGDSFGMTNIESLACGTPVITYRTGGCPETIDDKTGIVVERGDVRGIVNALRTIKNNREKYTFTQCRNRAMSNFNSKNLYQKYIDFYKELEIKSK